MVWWVEWCECPRGGGGLVPKSLCQPHVPVQQSDNDVPDLPPREPLAVSSDHLVPCRMGSARARQSGRLSGCPATPAAPAAPSVAAVCV